ncbi:MAG: DNA mismatch repair protein MutL, partial [Muribaculaceae bacterium]|nr:DNA mismatch repair protein MutL [Muribaculaceae bacterium]
AMTDVLAEMGFDISPMGGSAWAVNAVPASVAGKNVDEALAAMADEITATGSVDPSTLRSSAALALARAAAMRGSHALSTDEMEALTADLLRLPSPTYTPDGLRVIATIDNNSIDALFQ